MPKDADAQSTDVSVVADTTAAVGSSGLCRPQGYDWSEISHLFENGQVPEELLAITDPIEYNYLVVRLKKEFNDKTRSEYMKYMNLSLPYHSRRDECGGVISTEDWNAFTARLEGVIAKVTRKRARIIRRRKRKGIKKLPRKTLFKPDKRPNMAKDPLWREVFLDQSSDDSDSEEHDPFGGYAISEYCNSHQGIKSALGESVKKV